MGVDVSHLVLEALGDTDDQVLDESADSSESGDALAGTVVELNVDDILLWVGEVDCQVGEVLGELACGTLLDIAGCGLVDCEFVPRGPSTVTSLDLIATLTVQKKPVSYWVLHPILRPSALARLSIALPCRFLSSITSKARFAGVYRVEWLRTSFWDSQRLVGVNVLHLESYVGGVVGRWKFNGRWRCSSFKSAKTLWATLGFGK
jgi:hypothetical protein